MKVLVYENKEKDVNSQCLNSLITLLNKRNVSFDVIFGDETVEPYAYSVIFVIGGDGTLLRRTEYANVNSIPIIGINAGKLGFLTEFERSETEEAVNLFLQGQLVKDERSTLSVSFKGNTYFALNDVVLQRNYMDSRGMIISLDISIDSNYIDVIRGDGVIIATPTGSTAYSLSAGGAILTPDINAFSITPIAAHSFSDRPMVYSSDSICKLEYRDGCSAGVFIDGKLVGLCDKGDVVEIVKAIKPTIFLRKKTFNFFNRLEKKIKDRSEGR